MTDHAKALADALRKTLGVVYGCCGNCHEDITEPAERVIAAYDASQSSGASLEGQADTEMDFQQFNHMKMDQVCPHCGKKPEDGPAEAVTRENGDPLVQKFLDRRSNAEATLRLEKQELAKGKDWVITQEPVSCREIVAVCAALSTHQQQGDAEAFDQWFNAMENFSLRSERAYNEIEPGNRALLSRWLRAAFEAGRLSRAPQPDTVTELVKRDCLYKPCGYPTCKCVGVGIDARELTDALAARGKAG